MYKIQWSQEWILSFLNIHKILIYTKFTHCLFQSRPTVYLLTLTFTFIGVTFFILRVPRFFVGVRYIRRCPKTFRRLLKICYDEFHLTRTQQHKGTLTSLLKKENLEKVNHPRAHRLFFSLFGSGLFKYSIIIFQNVSVNAAMAQTFLPGVTNQNTGMSRCEIQVFNPQAWQSRLHALGVTLGEV